ncbi:MAG: TonB-dependent receptor [Bacteroidota bacterium]
MKKIALMLLGIAMFGVLVVEAQVKSISGTITSSDDGTGIPGVSIVVKGTTIGTITNIDGYYQLDVPNDAQTIVFSFVGMKTIEKPIEGTTINGVLEPDYVGLDEVIVTGYAVRGKNEITGSTVQVAAEELREVPVTSVDQALQGKVAGLTINTTSGTPGSTQDIRIRGIGSITASNAPLIVIDGVPVIQANVSGSSAMSSLNTLAALNSNDIESITVLKDASATSAYGARGSNGVIVITTNKGKVGKTKFNVSASYGFQNKADEGRQTLTAAQREELYLEAVINSYGAENGLSTPDDAWNYATENRLSWVDGYEEWREAGRPEGDWGNAVLNKNAPIYDINVSASGGDQISSFYVSLGYMNNEAVVVGNLFERITGQLNYQRNFSDKVKFSTTNNLSYTNQDDIFLETSAYFANPHILRYFMNPTIPVYTEDGEVNTDYSSSLYNILYLQEHNVNWNHMTRGLSNSFLEWEIVDRLKFKTLVGLDFILSHFKSYYNRHHGDSAQEGGSAEASVDQDFNLVFTNSLDYSVAYDDHTIAFKALMEYQKFKSWYLYGYGESFVTDGLTNIASAGTNFDATSSFSDWANLSYLGMVNYNYASKYILDLTFRREGSSRFAADQRYGNFWAVGAAWNMSEEGFLDGATWIDNLRMRGSYGISGNSGVGLNQYQSLLAFDADYAGLGASYPSGYGNPLLTWEKNRNYDVGFDFTFFDGKVDGSVSYFNKETFDLLLGVPLSQTSGHNTITRNVGAMVNKGFEAIVDWSIIRTKDFNLSVNANFATVNNEVTELAKDGEGEVITITGGDTKTDIGHPINAWYMREWAGVNSDTGVPQWYVNETDDDGNIVDPDAITEEYNEANRTYTGKSALPTYSGGGGFHVDFKGVYLDANVYFAGGHEIQEMWDHYTWDNGLYSVGLFNGVAELLERWQQPGDITDVPKFEFGYRPHQSVSTSTRQIYKGDYVRLKDLVLGYNLPASLVKQAKLDGVSVYVRGTNLWTYAFDERTRKGFDPETRADGRTGLETPPIKSIVFGVNLNF